MVIEAVPEAASAVEMTTVWGMTAMELHDAYWRSLGVAVVRPGGPAPEQAGLYLLCDGETTAVLDFRKVLDLMGWMAPDLCVVRARKSPLPAGQSAAASGEPVRCGFTPRAAVADAWRSEAGGFAAWRAVKRRLPGERVCAARPAGRVVAGASAQVVLERLAVVWEDPAEAVRGLKRIARGVFGWGEGAGRGRAKKGQRVWLGKGRRFDEVRGDGRACVLRDAS
jgi:hypothetical protein